MDCFICEGRKVMYRVWMAILLLFHRHLTSLTSDTRMKPIKKHLHDCVFD